MKSQFKAILNKKWAIALMAILCLLLPWKAQAQVGFTGYTLDGCYVNTVDSTNDVENWVCANYDTGYYDGNLDGTSEVDQWDDNGYVPEVGSEVAVSGLFDSGMNQGDSQDTFADAEAIPSLYTAYTVQGSYSECYDSTGTDDTSTCSWTSTSNGVWVGATVVDPQTPTLSTDTYTFIGSQIHPTTTVTFTYPISPSGYFPLTGAVYLYDWNSTYTTLNADYVVFPTSGSAIFYIKLSSGTHNIVAVYSGDSSENGYQYYQPTDLTSFSSIASTP